jgi:hypothetical protein
VRAWTRLLFASALLAGGVVLGAPAAERTDPDVRVLTTGDNSELVRTISIGHKRND